MKLLNIFTILIVLSIGAIAQESRPVNKKVNSRPLIIKTVSTSSSASTTFIATAYSLRGKMANGQNVHAGAIAADPRVLPIGSIVYIEGMGQFVVKDTGGAIKGSRIDIWMSSRTAALQFGKRPVKLRVISKGIKR